MKEVISSLNVHQCDEVPTRKIAAFSYFYDRAVDAGILNPGESAVVQVSNTIHVLFEFLPVLVSSNFSLIGSRFCRGCQEGL